MLYALLLVASAFAAVLPMVAFLSVVWWLDRYDREPIWLVALTFLWGGLIATLVSLVGNTSAHLVLTAVLGAQLAGQVTPVVVAPLVEEPAKALVLFLTSRSRHFDNMTDGFVYGAAAGFGFGMTENFLYVSTAAQTAAYDPLQGMIAWGGTVLARTFYSAVMHATTTACFGAVVGLVRFRPGWAQALVLPFGLALSMGLHALWNGLLTADGLIAAPVSLTALNFALFTGIFAGMFVLFQVVLLWERAILRRELRAEVIEHGTLPESHIEPLTSWRQRAFSTFVAGAVDQAAYGKAAVTLALRRHQVRIAKGRRKTLLQVDLDRLRREVRSLLGA